MKIGVIIHTLDGKTVVNEDTSLTVEECQRLVTEPNGVLTVVPFEGALPTVVPFRAICSVEFFGMSRQLP